MVHNNKVLTVSYGTFSCTLEGFDDSFGTMKAIAEYFRDLASDDRYFGAEPPQPDAEMLAHIARRSIARQVEAHSTDTGGIVLRAVDTPPAAAVAAPVTPPVLTPEQVATVAPDPTPEPTPGPTIESATAIPVASPPVAPIQAPQAQAPQPQAPQPQAPQPQAPQPQAPQPQAPQPQAPRTVVIEPAVILPEKVQERVATPAPAEAADVAPTASPEPVAATSAEPAPAAEPAAEPVPVEIVAQEVRAPKAAPASETAPAPDSIAAKLQRIRAVVSQNDTLEQMDDYTEDEHADGFVAAALQDITQSLNPDEEIDSVAEVSDSDEDDDVTQVLDQLDAIQTGTEVERAADANDEPVGDQMDTAKEDQVEITAEEIAPSEVTEDPVSDDLTADEAEFEAGDAIELTGYSAADATPESDAIWFDDLNRGTQDLAETEDESVDEEVDDLLSDAAPDSAPIQARVLKVKRADLEAAVAAGQLEQIDAPEEDDDFFADQDGSLSPEDEADLMRELAAVEDELADDADSGDGDDGENIFGEDLQDIEKLEFEFKDDLGPAQVGDEDEQEAIAHTALQQKVGDDEVDLSRLMAEADEKLEDPETSTRHETYSQLRAAVAVAEAERSAGGQVSDQEADDAYRDDLADVVRPRRPSRDPSRTTRPVTQPRPAPLKLVAEQRVDEGVAATPPSPVRPRRVMSTPAVATGASDATGADSAFADFAARVGATELPDLLEAAAAYLSFVEGHDKFSRPQLMNKVRLIKQDEYNREDGLRSFGQLLRDGKIEKRGGGRFAASGEIGFRPGEREAG